MTGSELRQWGECVAKEGELKAQENVSIAWVWNIINND